MKKFYLMSFVILTFISFGCQEEIVDGMPHPFTEGGDQNVYTNLIKDKLAFKVARNLAVELESQDILGFIEAKAAKRFDGDNNFLIEVSKNESINIGSNDPSKRLQTFGSVISGRVDVNKREAKSTMSFLDSVSKYHPLLQVFIPKLDSGIDFSKTNSKLLVAYIPTKIENGIIPAFDISGKYYELSSYESPEVPVIVISENERVIAISKESNSSGRILYCPIEAEPIFENDYHTYYNYSDYIESQNYCDGGSTGGDGGTSGGSGGTSGGGATNSPCDRDLNSGKDRLNRMKFVNMEKFKEVNEWFDGGQEIEVTITFAKANGQITKVTKFFSGSDSDFKDCGLFSCNTQWFYLNNTEIVTWDKTIYGDAMHYVWTEKDPGSPLELTSSFASSYDTGSGTKTTTTFTTKKTITNGDDLLGESIVEYCDQTSGEGEEYSTGKILFNVKQ